MPAMSPGVALYTCERALRQLMREVYSARYGADWINKVATEEQVAEWTKRQEAERQARTKRGLAVLSSDIIEYSQFFDLCTIARKDWEPLSVALGKRAETLPILDRFDRLRNTVAHNRELLPHEQDLLSGIAGELRNKVAIFMSTRDESDQYFPYIESVTDSLGYEVRGSKQSQLRVTSDVTLRVGDTLTFRCQGVDPQGRDLEWQLQIGNTYDTPSVAVGNDVVLQWDVLDGHVGDPSHAMITMSAVGTPHHRHGAFDAQALWSVRVFPPGTAAN